MLLTGELAINGSLPLVGVLSGVDAVDEDVGNGASLFCFFCGAAVVSLLFIRLFVWSSLFLGPLYNCVVSNRSGEIPATFDFYNNNPDTTSRWSTTCFPRSVSFSSCMPLQCRLLRMGSFLYSVCLLRRRKLVSRSAI